MVLLKYTCYWTCGAANRCLSKTKVCKMVAVVVCCFWRHVLYWIPLQSSLTIAILCVCNGYLLLFVKSSFCFAVGHLSFGKGGTPDSHGLLGKEFGKTFVPVCRYWSKFVYCDYMYCSRGSFWIHSWIALSHHFNSNFSSWTWVSRYQNVSILDFIGAEDDGGGEWW